uniref:NAD(P)-binding protein n=1 Tax=Mesocestoides corti TaxID=53468 RepID=A0A5K3FZW4_MESCO
MSNTLADLRGFVCLVTGASRGIGRGIAVGLGECGATVYITARTLRPKGESGDSAAPGSLEETASEITARGGVAIPVVVDHSDDAQVTELFARIRREQRGRLDILVNNVYAGVDTLASPPTKNRKYWHMSDDETPASLWDAVNGVGLRNHYICSALATRMMLEYRDELEDGDDKKAPKKEPRPGIIFNISSIGGLRYAFAAVYGIGKSIPCCLYCTKSFSHAISLNMCHSSHVSLLHFLSSRFSLPFSCSK